MTRARTSAHPAWRRRAAAVLSGALVLGCTSLAAGAADVTTAAVAPTYQPAYRVQGSITVPTSVARGVRCPGAFANGTTAYEIGGVTPGRVFSLTADDVTVRNDFDVRYFASASDCAAGVSPLHHVNHAGDEHAVVPDGASIAVVTLTTGAPGSSFTYAELPPSPLRRLRGHKAVTVVAVVEPKASFSVYHHDFLGAHHPWNNDRNRSNDIDFTQPPSTYIPGMPETTAVQLTMPTAEHQSQASLRALDAPTIDALRVHTPTEPNVYWFPGTKIVAAAAFAGPAPGLIADSSDPHASKAASVAAGNLHGTCSECVFVLLSGGNEAVKWATAQPWIDVVTNSWINPGTSGLDIGPTFGVQEDTRKAVERGQTVVWGAGNGVANQFDDVPSLTWESSQRGPDWVVTVGAVVSANDQSPRGAGRPVDIAAYGDSYPSAGGDDVDSEGVFAGTSNATPVVAGTFAKVIQDGRLAFGDETPGNAGGVVAEGDPVRCALPATSCPLDDGVLRRSEVQQLVFDNVLPSTPDATPDFTEVNAPLVPPTQEPNAAHDLRYTLATLPTDFTVATQGHGIVYGRHDGRRFVAEQRRFGDALIGAVAPYGRPPGERAWLTGDSQCRQRMWGTWGEGYYTAQAPSVVHPLDAIGAATGAACAAMPAGIWERVPQQSLGL